VHYYGFIGESRFEFCSSHLAPDGAIRMVGARPTPEHVAQADGTWLGPDNIQKQIEAIEEKYKVKEDAIKERLLNIRLSDGTSEEARTLEIQAEWAGIQAAKTQEIETVLLGGE
jgi:hypothetical protein